jgi:hypothetical protein
MLGNALGATGHTDASASAATARLARATPEVASAAVYRLIEVIATRPHRDLRTVLSQLDCEHPVLQEALVATVVPRVLNGQAGEALIPLVHRLPIEWTRGLASPVARRALLDFISERFVADTNGLRTFVSLLSTWTGTLNELAELTATILG